MADQTIHAYVVVLSFDAPGPLHVNSILAPDPASAGALAMQMFLQHTPTDAALINCLCAEMPAEQLRYLLRSVETGKTQGDVVSLVPRDPSGKASSRERAAEILRQHPELDVGDASTFTGPGVQHLWDNMLQTHRTIFGEPFGPPMPPGAA